MTIEWNELADYAGGDMDDDAASRLEDELFADPENHRVAHAFVAMTDAVAALHRDHGTTGVSVTAAELRTIRVSHRVFEVEIAAGEIVPTWIPEDHDVALARLRIALAEVKRLDLEFVDRDRRVYFAARDIAFDRDAGEVLVVCSREVAMMFETTFFRLVRADGRREVLGEFGIRNAPPPQ
jgi:hypothetical protein